MKRRILAIVLTVLLLLALIPAGSAAGIYFVAVNDTIPLTLSTDVSPFYQDGIYLIPHTAFTVSGLGVTPSFDAEKRVMTLFSRNKRLVFELTAGQVTDESGTTKKTVCVLKNGVAYLPAAFCAAHFGVSVSVQTSMEKYQVIRFTNGTQVYSDALFMEKAENLIAYRVQQHLNEQAATQVKPEVPVTPDKPVPPPAPESGKTPATVYLAVTDAASAAGALRVLSARNIPAVFFFTKAEILENPTTVLAVRAAGYPVGLSVEAGETAVASNLAEANAALDDLTQMKTLLVLLTKEQAADAKGYFAIDRQMAVNAARAAERTDRSSLVICGSNYSAVLSSLQGAEVRFRQLRETSGF